MSLSSQAYAVVQHIRATYVIEFWYFADRASQYIYLNINQLDALTL